MPGMLGSATGVASRSVWNGRGVTVRDCGYASLDSLCFLVCQPAAKEDHHGCDVSGVLGSQQLADTILHLLQAPAGPAYPTIPSGPQQQVEGGPLAHIPLGEGGVWGYGWSVSVFSGDRPP